MTNTSTERYGVVLDFFLLNATRQENAYPTIKSEHKYILSGKYSTNIEKVMIIII